MRSIVRLVVSLLPLASVPLLVWLLAGGAVDLGGGEKDLALLVPWGVWSLAFAASSLALWRRGVGLRRSIALSTAVGLIATLAFLVALAVAGKLGIAGRF